MKLLHLSELGRRTQAPAISWLMSAALARPNLISLAAGFTDNESLPVAEAHALLDEILRPGKPGQAALQYGMTPGDPALRRLTIRHLQRADGAMWGGGVYSQDRVIITSGSQQLLYMTAEALCDPGDIVLVEDPTYFVYLDILQSRGLRARSVRLDRDGLNQEHLEEVLGSLKRSGELRRVKMLYLVSYFQNPTGVTTNFEKKRAALKLLRQFERAAGHPIYLIEDAAYRELRFGDEDVPSALAADNSSERVIYTSTYSKPFATGVRVGYGILPEPVFTAVLRLKGNHDFGTSNLLQQLLARALASGVYQKQVARLRDCYARKARVMKHSLQEQFPDTVEWWEPQGGLYFWARLPRGLKSGMKSTFFQSALRHDVLYVPGELCYADDPARPKPNHEMRLSFGSAMEKDIREGIKQLGVVLHRLLGK
jgi:2-aminoadipate transaminase